MPTVPIIKPNLQIHFHSSERMPEVEDRSANLVSVSSIDGDADACIAFYNSIIEEIDRALADDGALLVQISDTWKKGQVMLRSKVVEEILSRKFRLTDMKIWERPTQKIMRIMGFSYFYVFVRKESKITRSKFEKKKGYIDGVWKFTNESKNSLNSWTFEMSEQILKWFSSKEDIVVDMTTGNARLPIVGSFMNRVCIGYEIDGKMRKKINANYEKYLSSITQP